MVCSMAETNSILIKNIFIMLSYAFQVLQEENYKKVAAEEFQNMEDLLAAILAKGVAQQVKRGREHLSDGFKAAGTHQY